jgi:hypothetical protein
MRTLQIFASLTLIAAAATAQVTYTYDKGGHLTVINYGPAGTITYSYDAAGHLIGRAVSTTPAVAAISSISPSSVNAGGGTFILTVNGSGFISSDVVLCNGAALATTFISSTVLQTTVPASLIAQQGSISIRISGSGVQSSTVALNIGASSPAPANVYYFAHLAFGGGWQATLTYVNYSPQAMSCQTSFFSDSGAPLPVPFAAGTSAVRSDNLAAGGDIHDQTQAPAGADLLTGWAAAQCTGPLKASLLYRSYKGTVAQGEAGVNAVTDPTTEFVSFAQTETGMAWANPSPSAADVTITVLDATGKTLGTKIMTVQPNQHGQANIGPLLGLSSFTGSLQITSSVPILTLLINFEAPPAFSSLPPADLPSGTPLAGGGAGGTAPGAATYYFPHLAFGGGWQSTLTYVNYSPASVSCQTTFYGNSGGALPVPFAAGTASTRTDNLAAGADIHDQTTAAAGVGLTEGWAEAQCTGPVKASLLYRLYNGSVPQGEAGVNAVTAPATEFASFAQIATGIAYVDPSSSSPATITIAGLDAAGAILGSTKVILQPNEHGVGNIGPLLGLDSFTGSVQITSTVPILSLLVNGEAYPVFSSLPPADLPGGTALSSQTTK